MSEEVPVIVRFPDTDTVSPFFGEVILTLGAAGGAVCPCETAKLIEIKNVMPIIINTGGLNELLGTFTSALSCNVITGIELEIV